MSEQCGPCRRGTPLILFIGMLLLGFIYVLWGRHGVSPTNSTTQSINEPTFVRVSPSELFQGDLKRLAPHLDFLATGSVKLETNGQIWVTMDLEEWNNGKSRPHGGGGSRVAGPAECSYSIRSIVGTNGRSQYSLCESIAQNGTTSSSRTSFDQPKEGASGDKEIRHKSITENVELSEGESTTLWGYLIFKPGEANSKAAHESIDEMAKRAEHAIIVKIKWTAN